VLSKSNVNYFTISLVLCTDYATNFDYLFAEFSPDRLQDRSIHFCGIVPSVAIFDVKVIASSLHASDPSICSDNSYVPLGLADGILLLERTEILSSHFILVHAVRLMVNLK